MFWGGTENKTHKNDLRFFKLSMLSYSILWMAAHQQLLFLCQPEAHTTFIITSALAPQTNGVCGDLWQQHLWQKKIIKNSLHRWSEQERSARNQCIQSDADRGGFFIFYFFLPGNDRAERASHHCQESKRLACGHSWLTGQLVMFISVEYSTFDLSVVKI